MMLYSYGAWRLAIIELLYNIHSPNVLAHKKNTRLPLLLANMNCCSTNFFYQSATWRWCNNLHSHELPTYVHALGVWVSDETRWWLYVISRRFRFRFHSVPAISLFTDNIPLPFGRICFVVLVTRKGGESSWSGPWHLGCTLEVSFSMCTAARTSSYSPVGPSVFCVYLA